MFRNKEIQRFVGLFLSLTAVSALFGFMINTAAGILCLISAVVFGAAFFIFTRTRYQHLAELSHQIDLVLHNADRLTIDTIDEGELSILQSEITKMTLRIREQNAALEKEKLHLADSLADIAHQLRTPLTSINILLSLVADSTDANARQAYIREAEELLLRMDWLLTALLKLSRLDAGVIAFQSTPVAVNALLRDALSPLLISLELHAITVEINVPADLTIIGDHNWLAEALQNLLKNCLESAGDGGRIIITGTANPLYSELTIRDNGPGFSPDDLPHLFDRFYRGQNASAAGYGIGLSLSKMIITRQNGTITAKNSPQGGALFTLHFPK